MTTPIFSQAETVSVLRDKKAPSPEARGFLKVFQKLQFGDFNGLRAFFRFHDFEFHFLTFGQGFETVALNFLIVNKEIFRTVFGGYETVTFLVIKPLNFSFRHFTSYFLLLIIGYLNLISTYNYYTINRQK